MIVSRVKNGYLLQPGHSRQAVDLWENYIVVEGFNPLELAKALQEALAVKKQSCEGCCNDNS